MDRFGFFILGFFWGGCILFLFLLLCVCLQYVLMFMVTVNIEMWLVGKIMNFSYSGGKEPGVCILGVIAVPYLKLHAEKVILRNSPECGGLGTALGKAELVDTGSAVSAPRSCLCGPVGLLVPSPSSSSKLDCSCPASLICTSWNW